MMTLVAKIYYQMTGEPDELCINCLHRVGCIILRGQKEAGTIVIVCIYFSEEKEVKI